MIITAGMLLVAGATVFLVGAAAWRMAYQQPPVDSLPVIHADRGRRIWIHLWMIGGVVITSAGVGALAVTGTMAPALVPAAAAVIVHTLGGACMLVSLTFGVTVVPWAAEHTVRHAEPPEIFSALSGWANSLYLVHMLCSYATFTILGAARLIAPTLPRGWGGWVSGSAPACRQVSWSPASPGRSTRRSWPIPIPPSSASSFWQREDEQAAPCSLGRPCPYSPAGQQWIFQNAVSERGPWREPPQPVVGAADPRRGSRGQARACQTARSRPDSVSRSAPPEGQRRGREPFENG